MMKFRIVKQEGFNKFFIGEFRLSILDAKLLAVLLQSTYEGSGTINLELMED